MRTNTNSFHSLLLRQMSLLWLYIQGMLIGKDHHARLCASWFLHIANRTVIHGNLCRIPCLAVIRGQLCRLFQNLLGRLFAAGLQNHMGTGDILGVKPDIIFVSRFQRQLVILPIVPPPCPRSRNWSSARESTNATRPNTAP
jgi:hypothetical protein